VYDLATQTASYPFSPGIVPNGNYRATLLSPGVADAAGNALLLDSSVEFFSLAGDVNHDRYVDSADQAILTAHLNQPGTFGDGDLNYSGTVDSADQAILDAYWHYYLPVQGVLNLPASGGDDVHTLRPTGAGLLDIFLAGDGEGNPTWRVPAGVVTSVAFDGGGGSDTLKIGGIPGGPDTVVFDASSVSVSGLPTINHSGVKSRLFDGGGGGDTLVINSGTVVVTATQHLGSLSIAPGVAALDLRDHDLIVDYSGASPIGASDGAAYTGVTGMIQAGRNHGAWNGAGGIGSSSVVDGFTTLAIGEASNLLGLDGTATDTWSGHAVDATCILIKLTYAGDANLDGFISGDDYSAIDFSFAAPGAAGYANGDFNYDGIVSGDDYSVIDFNIVAQGQPLTTSTDLLIASSGHLEDQTVNSCVDADKPGRSVFVVAAAAPVRRWTVSRAQVVADTEFDELGVISSDNDARITGLLTNR
jgi:hypothetical protein